MSAAPPVTHVFVYGTLRPGSTNPHSVFLTFRCRILGSAKLRGRLFRHGSQYVAVHEPEGKREVTGDVLQLPPPHADKILDSLDRYEGIGSGLPGPAAFQRQKVVTTTPEGDSLECWAWLFMLPVHGLTEIRSGDALA